MLRLLLIGSLAGSIGCRKIDPAPEDFDALLHYFWQKANEGSDAEIAEGVRNLHEAIGGDTLDGPQDGTLSRLTNEETAFIELDATPDTAAGIYLLNPYQCSFDDLTTIVTHLDQQLLYPGVYDGYERDYTTSREAFVDGQTNRLEWDLHYGATLLGSSYTATVKSMMRRVPNIGDEASEIGDFLLWQAYIEEPADFGDSAKSLTQDYQIDLYYPINGRIIHAYGIWREANYGAGFSTESEAVQRITLNNLIDWDEQTETYCMEGIPE